MRQLLSRKKVSQDVRSRAPAAECNCDENKPTSNRYKYYFGRKIQNFDVNIYNSEIKAAVKLCSLDSSIHYPLFDKFYPLGSTPINRLDRTETK